ncbi:hypothetical protein GS416_10515 [Rhodococcus hoagii]|nr:hypothetical protein [Prescottella equi]
MTVAATDVVGDLEAEPVRHQDLDARIGDLLRAGFDVANEVPVRARILRLDPGCTFWSSCCTTSSRTASRSRLCPRCRGGLCGAGRRPTTGWEPLTVQYADFALWQRRVLGDPDDPSSMLAREEAYWLDRLAAHRR